jgi:uncharacterized membrane protein HdeD (DUF308 family)
MPDPIHRPGPSSADLSAALAQMRARWGWFVALGAVLIVLGIVAMAHIFTATLVSVLFIGAMMLVGGAGQIIHAWRIKHIAGFIFWTLSGMLYAGAGLIAIVDPEVGASALTLLLGATLIGAGALRLWIWFNNRAQAGWLWLALSGVITLLTGMLIAVNWPGNSVWILGLLLAFDLLLQGWTAMLIGFALKGKATS